MRTVGVTFFLQLICFLTASSNPAYLAIEELLIQGQELADNNQFSDALKVLNRAMGSLKQAPRSHPLRVETEKLIKIVKGRSLVARYRGSKVRTYSDPNALSPLEEETREFSINQLFGKVLARKVWESRDELSRGETLGVGRRVTVLPKGGIELTALGKSGVSIRSVQAASFDILGDTSFALHSGSYVMHSLGKEHELVLKSPLVDIRISSTEPFALMVGITTNGGMKVICLLGEIKLNKEGHKISLVPGELSFALPDGFSRKMNVELSTLLVTSNLLTDFEQPPVFLKKLRQQAMMQALRTRKRFRTVVGDVKGNDNFELKVLEEN